MTSPSKSDGGQITIIAQSQRGGRDEAGEEVAALVIAWCGAEPDRIGEIALLPSAAGVLVLGRGDRDATERSLRFFRQRPTGLETRPALTSPGISRRQLLVE